MTCKKVYNRNHSDIRRTHETSDELPAALESGHLEAVIENDTALWYQMYKGKERGMYERLTFLPYQFNNQDNGLVVQDDSPLDEQLDTALLKIRGIQSGAGVKSACFEITN